MIYIRTRVEDANHIYLTKDMTIIVKTGLRKQRILQTNPNTIRHNILNF